MVLKHKLRRLKPLLVAAVLAVAGLVPALSQHKASAYGLVPQRSIQITSSKTSATNTTYKVTFTSATGYTVKAIVVYFCAGTSSPIIGDSCTAPAGFTVGTPTVTLNSGISGGTWVSGASAPSANELLLSDSTGNAQTANTTVISFNITTVTNPSTTGTFYGRIATFSVAAGGGAGAPDESGNNYTTDPTKTVNIIDAGGIAMSTANQLTITAKVQERLTFCVYTSTPSGSDNDCTLGTGTGSSLILGDANGVLDNTTQYTKNGYFGVSTNANGFTGNCATSFDPQASVCSVVVRMKGGTLKTSQSCPDGSGQTCSINPVGGTATTGATGSEQFGMYVSSSGAPLVATQPYDGGTGTQFAFDDNNTTGTQSPYGQAIGTFNASTEKTGTMTFVGNIGATTEPGIYQTILTFIATGTY